MFFRERDELTIETPRTAWPQRPMVWAAAAFVLGILGSRYFSLVESMAAVAIGTVAGVILMLAVRDARARPFVVASLFSVAGLGWAAAHYDAASNDTLSTIAWNDDGETDFTIEGIASASSIYRAPSARAAPLPVEVDAQTSATYERGEYVQFRLEADRIEWDGSWTPIHGMSLVRWSNAAFPIHAGQRVRVTAKLDGAMSRVNPGMRGPEFIYRNQGMHTVIRPDRDQGVSLVEPPSYWHLPYWASRLRHAQARVLDATIPDHARAMAYTVWLGERGGVHADTMERYTESGTAHIMAVSGVHLTIVFVMAAAVLRMFMGRRWRVFTLLGIIVLFVMLTGARISVVRAAIMISVHLIGELFDRDPDPPTSLSIAALLILLHDPLALYQPGFQLSFLCVASLLLFGPGIAESISIVPHPFRFPVSASIAVQILPLPVAAAIFHVIPFLAPVINIIVVPLLGCFLWLIMFTVIAGSLLTELGIIFGAAAGVAFSAIDVLVTIISDWPPSRLYAGPPSIIAIALYYLGFVLFLNLRTSRHVRWGIAAACIVFAAVLWPQYPGQSFVAMLDVGHGDATVIRSPARKVVLIDGGDRSEYGDQGQRTVIPFLRTHGIGKIDIMIATHADRDHVGGLFEVVDTMEIGELWISAATVGGPWENALAALCEERGIPVRRVDSSVSVDLGGAILQTLHPPANWPDVYGDNDNAIVLRYEQEGVRVLLTADVEYAGESALLRAGETEAEILKVPHHGSNTSSRAAFIEAVAPEIAIVSTGRRPGRRPLHAEVAGRYEELGVPVLRTDVEGGIMIRIRDGEWALTGVRQSRGWLPGSAGR